MNNLVEVSIKTADKEIKSFCSLNLRCDFQCNSITPFKNERYSFKLISNESNLKLEFYIFTVDLIRLLYTLPEASHLEVISRITDEEILKSIEIESKNFEHRDRTHLIQLNESPLFSSLQSDLLLWNRYMAWSIRSDVWYCYPNASHNGAALKSPGLSNLILNKWTQIHEGSSQN